MTEMLRKALLKAFLVVQREIALDDWQRGTKDYQTFQAVIQALEVENLPSVLSPGEVEMIARARKLQRTKIKKKGKKR